MTRPLSRKGFTLIELLVVVLILGVLVAVALPAYMSSTASAKRGAGDHNARALASALKSYAVKNGSFPAAATGVSDAAIVSDMGGSIPNNPCSATAGAGGYTYTYSTATSVSIVAASDACAGYTPKTYALNL